MLDTRIAVVSGMMTVPHPAQNAMPANNDNMRQSAAVPRIVCKNEKTMG